MSPQKLVPTMKMETAGSSVRLVPTYKITWYPNPEDHNAL